MVFLRIGICYHMQRYGNFSNRIKRTVNAVYKLPNNDGTKILDTKYPWEARLYMRIGAHGTGTDTPFGMDYHQPCPYFEAETDTWSVGELMGQQSTHTQRMKINQCSGSLITNRHILTSAECVTTNSEYLRQNIKYHNSFY